jgi:hypothetical protein
MRALAAALLALSACSPYWTCADGPTFCAGGVPVFLDAALEPAYSDAGDRVAAQLDASLVYWGVPREALAGWRIRYTATDVVPCNAPEAAGCWDDGERTIALTFPASTGCIEASPLPHEVGHFVDRGHTDPRWRDFAPLLRLNLGIPACGAMAPLAWPLSAR